MFLSIFLFISFLLYVSIGKFKLQAISLDRNLPYLLAKDSSIYNVIFEWFWIENRKNSHFLTNHSKSKASDLS